MENVFKQINSGNARHGLKPLNERYDIYINHIKPFFICGMKYPSQDNIRMSLYERQYKRKDNNYSYTDSIIRVFADCVEINHKLALKAGLNSKLNKRKLNDITYLFNKWKTL
jgi:hypothetical protein